MISGVGRIRVWHGDRGGCCPLRAAGAGPLLRVVLHVQQSAPLRFAAPHLHGHPGKLPFWLKTGTATLLFKVVSGRWNPMSGGKCKEVSGKPKC